MAKKGDTTSPLAIIYDVNFKIIKISSKLDKRYRDLYENNMISKEEIEECVLKYNNVVSGAQYTLKVIK